MQKPLTHTIYEARLMGQVAREKKVATQMGNQGTADVGCARTAALLRAGAVGKSKRSTSGPNRPIWPQGGDRPKREPVPANLKWDLWIGPAPLRPYGQGLSSVLLARLVGFRHAAPWATWPATP